MCVCVRAHVRVCVCGACGWSGRWMIAVIEKTVHVRAMQVAG